MVKVRIERYTQAIGLQTAGAESNLIGRLHRPREPYSGTQDLIQDHKSPLNPRMSSNGGLSGAKGPMQNSAFYNNGHTYIHTYMSPNNPCLLRWLRRPKNTAARCHERRWTSSGRGWMKRRAPPLRQHHQPPRVTTTSDLARHTLGVDDVGADCLSALDHGMPEDGPQGGLAAPTGPHDDATHSLVQGLLQLQHLAHLVA